MPFFKGSSKTICDDDNLKHSYRLFVWVYLLKQLHHIQIVNCKKFLIFEIIQESYVQISIRYYRLFSAADLLKTYFQNMLNHQPPKDAYAFFPTILVLGISGVFFLILDINSKFIKFCTRLWVKKPHFLPPKCTRLLLRCKPVQ